MSCITLGLAVVFFGPSCQDTQISDFRKLADNVLQTKLPEIRSKAIEKLRSTSGGILKKLSSEVIESTGSDPVGNIAANYSFAILPINANGHLKGLFGVYEIFIAQIGSGKYDREVTKGVEHLPYLYFDVFRLTKNPLAPKLLWTMSLDGSRATIQHHYFYRCLRFDPKTVLSTVRLSDSPKLQGIVWEYRADSNRANLRAKIALLATRKGPAQESARTLMKKLKIR